MVSSGSTLLWLRWSARDVRRRWGSVLVIALVIALGTGVYAGLGSTATWRRLSNDASFSQLHVHDVLIELSTGTTVGAGTLADVLAGIDDAGLVERVDERLVVPTQIDASTADDVVLVPGRIVGMPVDDPDAVDALDLTAGRLPQPAAEPAELVFDLKFADHHDVALDARVRLSGGQEAVAVGQGQTPEYFLITGDADVGFLGEANFGVAFTDLATAQEIAGRPGQVSGAALTLRDGVDRESIAAQIRQGLAERAGVSATVSTLADLDAHRLLYDDIDSDQKIWTVLSGLVLAAASIAAFNLIGRIVESQRRELGIQMALGVPPSTLARRPLLISAAIASAGALLGIGVGLAIGAAMRNLLVDVLPMPHWRTPFQYGVYARAAALGFVIPFVATVLPIRRAIRVEPVEAISTTHRGGDGGRRARRRRHSRRNSLAQLPWRNLARNRRRSLLTAIGVGAAIAALVGVLGMLDSFTSTIRRGEQELTRVAADRVTVQLDGFHPVGGPTVAAVRAAASVGPIDARLELPATLGSGDGELDAIVSLLDLDGAAWTPTIADRDGRDPTTGIVLATKAASDLGIVPGDSVEVVLPQRGADGAFSLASLSLPVVGTHPNPTRSLAYLDVSHAADLGLDGLANSLDVRPADGATPDEVQRAVFALPGVAWAQPITAVSELFEDALDQFIGFLIITEVAVLVLALLIAFNTTSISIEERAREHATLFAFGLPVRSVVALLVKESVVLGLAATIVGTGLGYLLVRWMVEVLVADTVPELGFIVRIGSTTLVTALVVGVMAVAATPLLLVRRLRRMNIPDTLRVME